MELILKKFIQQIFYVFWKNKKMFSEKFLIRYSQDDSIQWENIAASRIKKYKRAGLVLRGARYREGFSQKELAKQSKISQENISKMESGKRPIGKIVAKKLSKVLRVNAKLLQSDSTN
jgi:DNA-binding XRE family transcriptional regulator